MASALDLDRVGPTRRPARPWVGKQEWRELLLLHWSVPVEDVRPLVPAELELDPWDGRMWIGAVPFRMEAVRWRGMPRALGFEFLELNLRTYVHHRGAPGVWFFSLEAASRLAVWGARVGFGLPYWYARMASERRGEKIAFRSERRAHAASFDVRYRVGERLGPSAPGTLEHFLLERYLLFAVRRGRLVRGDVHHVPYDAHLAHVDALTHTLSAPAGLPALDRVPELAHFCPALDVEIFAPRGELPR